MPNIQWKRKSGFWLNKIVNKNTLTDDLGNFAEKFINTSTLVFKKKDTDTRIGN